MKKILCPTCSGKGTIDDPKCMGITMGYCGPNAERFPQVICQTCNCSGWIEISNNITPQDISPYSLAGTGYDGKNMSWK